MCRRIGAAVLLVGLFFPAGPAWAQMVSGRVLDTETGQPIPGATVVVDGTTQGAATDVEGRYELEDLAPGSYVLVARALGYQSAEQPVTLTRGENIAVDFRLEQDVLELGGVEVVSDRLQDQRSTQPSLVEVTPKAAQRLPGAGEDVLRALQTTPGVLAANDFSSQLIVRGGGPDENLVILDDVEVFNPYRLYGVVSMFNPAVVSDIRLMTGGFPARYGDRLSSVLDVTLRAGTAQEPLAGSINTSVSNTNLVLEGRTPLMNGSWLLTGRRTYYDVIVGVVAKGLDAIDEDFTFPNFSDLQGKLVLRPHRAHRLQAGAIFSRDALDVAVAGDEEDEERSAADRFAADDLTRNDVLYGAWHWAPTPDLLSKLTVSWYRNGGTFGSDGQFVPRDDFNGSQLVASEDTVNVFEFAYDQQFRFRKWGIHQHTLWERGRHFLEAGAGVDLLNTTLQYDLELNDVGRAYFESVQQNNPQGPGAFPETFDQGKNYYRYNAFVQDRVALFGERLFLQPGLRFDYYRIIRRAYVSPRFNFSYALDPVTTLRGAWGVYRQSPGFEKLIDEGQVFDLSEGGGVEGLSAERTQHFVLGLSRWLGTRFQARMEVYAKTFDGLIVQQRDTLTNYVAEYVGSGPQTSPEAYRLRLVTSPGLTSLPVNDARGRAYGLELVLEKRYSGTEDRLSGWASYAYARAYRSRTGLQDPTELIRTPFDYDRRHVANLVLNVRLGRKWELGATFRYGTGFPYTPVTGAAPIVVTRYNAENPLEPPTVEVLTNSITGLARFEVHYGGEEEVNTARLPAYHRLDLRLSRSLRLFGLSGQVYADVINVYNRKNVLAYRYTVVVDPEQPQSPPRIRREQSIMLPILPTLGFSFTF